jgi:hypothetical protein
VGVHPRGWRPFRLGGGVAGQWLHLSFVQ